MNMDILIPLFQGNVAEARNYCEIAKQTEWQEQEITETAKPKQDLILFKVKKYNFKRLTKRK